MKERQLERAAGPLAEAACLSGGLPDRQIRLAKSCPLPAAQSCCEAFTTGRRGQRARSLPANFSLYVL